MVFRIEGQSAPTPPPPLNQPEQDIWKIRQGDGTIRGPFLLNDLENFASQGKLGLDVCVYNESRFGKNWIAVGRVPELFSLIRQSADIAHLSGNRFSGSRDDSDFFTTNQVATFISGASFVLAALIWLWTIIGIPFAIIAAGMAGFDIITAATTSQRSYQQNRDRFQLAGILQIILGFVTLGNLFAIICGIVNLASLPRARKA